MSEPTQLFLFPVLFAIAASLLIVWTRPRKNRRYWLFSVFFVIWSVIFTISWVASL